MITLGTFSIAYEAMCASRPQVVVQMFADLISGADREDVVHILRVMLTPFVHHKMHHVAETLVRWYRARGLAPDGSKLNDATLPLTEYAAAIRAEAAHAGRAPVLGPDTPLQDAISVLTRARTKVEYVAQVLRSASAPTVLKFVVAYFQRAWKLHMFAHGRVIEALAVAMVARGHAADKSTAKRVVDEAMAFTYDAETVAKAVLTGAAPELTARITPSPVLLRKEVFHEPQLALDALNFGRKRLAGGGVREPTIATLKLDGYSATMSFYRGADGVRHAYCTRTRGQSCAVAGGLSAMCSCIAAALGRDPAFENLIVGGEVLCCDADGVPMPSVDMNAWTEPRNGLAFVAYHALLHNGVLGSGAATDLRALESALSPEVKARVARDPLFAKFHLFCITDRIPYAPAEGVVAMLDMCREVKHAGDLCAYFDEVCDAGQEGLVVSNRSGPLKLGKTARNDGVVKLKPARTTVPAAVIAFRTRDSGAVKELIVAVADDGARPTRLVAYATVGNLSDAARSALPSLFARPEFNCQRGSSMTHLPYWLVNRARDVDVTYLNPPHATMLPAVELIGYPCSRASRRYGAVPGAWGVPQSLLFCKLVPDSVRSLLERYGLDAVKITAGGGDLVSGVRHALAAMHDLQPDSATFAGKTFALVMAGFTAENARRAVALGEEILRNGGVVGVFDGCSSHQYTIDASVPAHEDWIYTCVLNGRVSGSPDPVGEELPTSNVCPTCGHRLAE